MSHEAITFAILGVTVAIFIWDRLPVAVVALGVAMSLWATGVLDLDQALAGFSDPAVLFIAALFVVSEALDITGVTSWLGRRLVDAAGESRSRVLTLTMLLCAAVTALITVNGSVAALVPVVVVIALRLKREPSQLMMPLAFAAHAGSLLVLIGSPVNIVVSAAADGAGAGKIGFFEFGLVGLPLVIVTIAVVVLFGERLLPHRDVRAMTSDFSSHARTLVHQYGLDEGDEMMTATQGAAEVVIPPRSDLIGETAYPGMATGSGDLVVLAVQRREQELAGETVLAAGDVLLLQGSWKALDLRIAEDPNVIAVDRPERVQRQAAPLGRKAGRVILILAAMVIVLATGAVPPAAAGILAAMAIVVSGAISVEQAYRGIGWTTVLLVAGMIPLSTAMTKSGAAGRLADGLVGTLGDAGPHLLLAGIVVLVLILGQLISNMATALIVIPVAISAAAEAGVSAKPMLMAVAVASAAAFLTPVATPANLMVMRPGGYRFGDYWRLGLPLLVVFGLAAVLLVPVFWSF